jgi:imidazolonepropionase
VSDILVHNIGRLTTWPGDGVISGPEMDHPQNIPDCAVLVRNGRIRTIAPEDEIWTKDDLPRNIDCIDADGRCVVPGFVDPHTHAVFEGSREHELRMKIKGATYLDILSSGGGILRTVVDTRAASLDELVSGMDRRLDRMMAYGTTSAEIKSGYGLDRESELRVLRAVKSSKHPMTKVATFLGPHALPPEHRSDPEAFLSEMISLLPQISAEKLAEFADIFCDRGAFHADQARRYLKAAKDAGLKVKIHSDEIENIGGTFVGADLGAVSADHLLVSTEEDLLVLKESGTIPVLLPGTLLTIFSERIPPVSRMMELGLPIALGTDLNPNCMLESMQLVQALGCYRLRMTPNEVLAASTVNAAFAIGLGARKGRIAPGYDGDLIVLKDDMFEKVPYHFGVNHVDTVVIGGKAVIRGQGW